MAKDLSLDLALHQRLMEGDPTALSRIISHCADEVIAMARRKYPRVPLDEIWSLLDDILLGLHAHPQKYIPGKMKLKSFLFMALNADLANHTRKHKHPRPNDRHLHEDVELFSDFGNTDWEPLLFRQMAQRDVLNCVYCELKKLIPDEPEYTIAEMVIEKIREREKYAVVLGIENLSDLEIKTQVDRCKDKIKRKLSRNNWPSLIEKCKQS